MRDIPLKVDQDQRTVAGYAVVWGATDYYGTRFKKGVFSDDIDIRKDRIRFLWQHDPTKPLGKVDLEEDDRGLKVTATIDEKAPAASEALNLVDGRLVDGFSVGFIPIEMTELDPEEEDDGAWLLFERARLLEVSLVTLPAQDDARVEEIRSMKSMLHKRAEEAEDAPSIEDRLSVIEKRLDAIENAKEDDDEEDEEEEDEDHEDHEDMEEMEASASAETRQLMLRIETLEMERDLAEFDASYPIGSTFKLDESTRGVIFDAWRRDKKAFPKTVQRSTGWKPEGIETGISATNSDERLMEEAKARSAKTGKSVPDEYQALKWRHR